MPHRICFLWVEPFPPVATWLVPDRLVLIQTACRGLADHPGDYKRQALNQYLIERTLIDCLDSLTSVILGNACLVIGCHSRVILETS